VRGRADDRAAARQDSGDLAPAERDEELLDHSAPALAYADDVVASRPGAARDRADHRIEAGAVAAAGENADTHLV